MTEEKLLTVREVSMLLSMSEKEVIDLAEDGMLPAYKVGGIYLRFKKEQVEGYKKTVKKPLQDKSQEALKYPLGNRLADFFYFNDFYIVSFLIIIAMFFIIFRG